MNEIENERRAIIEQIISKLDDDGVAVTNESVAAKTEENFPGFNFDPELDGATVAEMNATEAADGSEPDAEPDDTDAIRAKVVELDQRAGALRGDIFKLTHARQEARGVLAQCIADFQHGIGPRITQQDLARQHIAASQAARQEQVDSGHSVVQEVHPGPSYLDHEKARYGNSETFCRKQIRVGHSRGAFPASMRGARLNNR